MNEYRLHFVQKVERSYTLVVEADNIEDAETQAEALLGSGEVEFEFSEDDSNDRVEIHVEME
jgi:hypothetical protein